MRFAKKRCRLERNSRASKRLRFLLFLCIALIGSQLLSLLGTALPSMGSRFASTLNAQAPPMHVSVGPTPSVRLGDECVPYALGTVEVPILVKNDSQADGLKVSIDYDEVFLGYAWYRTSGTTWRVERVAPYGQRRMTLVLKRNSKSTPADPEAEQPEVPALYAVFYLKDAPKPEDQPFRVRSPISLGAEDGNGGTDSYFFTVVTGQQPYRPVRTRVTDGSVTIFYRDGVELGGGSVTKTEQLFTLPLYLTYTESGEGGVGATGQRVFTVGIDYDEIFLSLTGVRGIVPPLADGENQIPVSVGNVQGKAAFILKLAESSPATACHVHVADLVFSYNGLAPPDDHLLVEPHLILDAPGDGAQGPAPEAQHGDGEGDAGVKAGAGGSGTGTEPGVVGFLPPHFVRGNVSSDAIPDSRGIPNLRGDRSDVILILASIFLGKSELPCADAADVNDNGKVELSDAVLLLNYLFRGGPPPVAPFPNPGEDRGDEDDLGCDKPLPYFLPTHVDSVR